jgi:hypothetical protein
MKKIMICFIFLIGIFLISHNAWTAEDLVEIVAVGCEKELKSYCSEVTPGKGRILACLYAHNDKISGKCEYALFDTAAKLERFVASLTYVVNECEEDINKYCASVVAGEGRIAACLLEKNKDKISERCKQAAEEVDFKYEKK